MKKCILIFDDDPQILMVCKIILERHNYQVDTRSFCDDIIIDINKVKPDVVLMDLWIPLVGGEAAITLMKNNSETRQIPIILFSANAEIEIIATRARANGFLRKPFDINELLGIIQKFIVAPPVS
jgi:DNA-binding NtrC family response regulator